jgi:hypothetical protein
VEPYLHSPNTHSWCGVKLKYRGNFTFKVNANFALTKEKQAKAMKIL